MKAIVLDDEFQDAVAVGTTHAEKMHREKIHAHEQADATSLVGILAYLSVICLLSIRNMLDMQVDTSWIFLVHNLWYR